jgi:GT2 family glycosyltransferase
MKIIKNLNITKKYDGQNKSTKEIIDLENSIVLSSHYNHDKFKDATVIFIVTYHYLDAIQATFNCILNLLDRRDDIHVVILDNQSTPEIQDYLKSLKHPHIDLNLMGKNIGKALAVNSYGQKYINEGNLPSIVVSIDPDIIFKTDDFNNMIKATLTLKNIGMLGMRYRNNNCNPEMNLFFPSKKIKGLDKQTYRIKSPFLCTVAGPIFAIKGSVFRYTLGYRLFPKTFLATYGGDDSATYDALRKKFINGYLEGTEVIHLRSADKVAPELLEYRSRD